MHKPSCVCVLSLAARVPIDADCTLYIKLQNIAAAYSKFARQFSYGFEV